MGLTVCKYLCRWPALFCLLLALVPGKGQAFEDPFQMSWEEGERTVVVGEGLTVDFMFQIPPGHYLYKDKMKVDLVVGKGVSLTGIDLSPAIIKLDPFFKKELEIYENQALLSANIRVDSKAAAGLQQAELVVHYQGCSSKLCFREQTRSFLMPLQVRTAEAAGAPTPIQGGQDRSLTEWFQESLQARGPVAYLLAFLGGILTDFTPCVIPLIPLTLAVIGIRREKRAARNFLLTFVLVLSMSGIYALFGVGAALLGLQLGFLFQSPYFLLVGAFLFLLFSLSLFGLFELQAPLPLRNRLAKMGGKGYGGASLAGMTLGVLAAPCVGPIIGAILVWVGQTRDVVHGFGLLFVFGLGMGSLILLVGTFYGSLAGRIHGGPASAWVQKGLGVLLLVPAIYYGSIAFTGLRASTEKTIFTKTELFWVTDPIEALALAEAEGKKVLIDFYADWCLPCLEWEQKTFSDGTVQQAIRNSFIPLKVDCTQNTPVCKELVGRYQVVGWPTILTIDSNGDPIDKGRIVGEVYTPDRFRAFLRKFR